MVIVAAVALCGCIKDRYVSADLKVGDSLPDFEVVMNDGRVVTDDALRETVSVVMFFHTSCPDCQKALPEMQKVYDEYLQKGVSFAFISREESESSISLFWEQKGLEMPYSAQNDRKVYHMFASERIPRVYICEKGGKISRIFTDDPNPSYEDVKSALEEIIR